MDEEAPLVYSIKTEDKSDVGDTSNVEYVELLECDEGLMTLSDGTNWYKVPLAEGIEVTTEEDIDCKDEPPDFVDADQEPFIESDHLDEVNIDDNSQVILLGDGSLAFLETSTDTDIVENYETVVLEKETNIPNKKLRKFKCSVEGCPRSFRTSHHLKVHLRIHTGDRPYKCPMEGCEKAFSTDVARKSHIRTHTGEKPYPCTSISCNKSFKTSGDLQKHIRTHTGERPFSCPFKGCNKSFTTSNIRKVHLRTHTGEKPYVCEKEGCNKRFASSTNFQNHTRIHLGVKPYVCKACSKKFTEYSSLYKHRLVHSQLRRHLCNFCHKSYRQLSTLVIHQRTNHGVIYSDGSDIVFEDISSQDTNSFSNISPDV